MAIRDKLLNFTPLVTGQDIGALAVGSVASTDVIDYGVAKDWSQGRPLVLNVKMADEAVDSAGDAATVEFELRDSADASTFLSITPGKMGTVAIAEALLVAGYTIMKVPLPIGIRRYLHIYVTCAVENLTAGMYHAWLGLE